MLRSATFVVLCALLAGCGSFTPVHTAFNKGVYLYSQQQYTGAIDAYRLAIEEDAGDWRARFNLAMALEAQADRLKDEAGSTHKSVAAGAASLQTEAEQQYMEVLKLKPHNVRAAVNLTAIRYRGGARKEAKQELRRLAQEHADLVLPRTALAAHLMDEGQLPLAEEQLRAAADLDSGNLYTRYLLGEVLRRQGKWEKGREAYQQALDLAPGDLATLQALGELELAAGRLAEARTQFESVLAIDHGQYRAQADLARVSELQENWEGAILHHLLARAIAPDDAARARHAARLKFIYRRLAGLSESGSGR